MRLFSWLFSDDTPAPARRQAAKLGVEALGERTLPSVGVGFVGLAKAPAADVSYLAGQIKTRSGETEVSFLPFEFSPTNPFGNATNLVKAALPGSKGSLRMTVDLKWFVHSDGKNGKLDDGASAAVFGRPAQRAFWTAWDKYNPAQGQQPQPIADFLARVRQADAWVKDLRNWAVRSGVAGKLNFTYVPVLEDEFPTVKGYNNLLSAVRAQQSADGIAPTQFRRSKNGDNSAFFRPTGAAMELHGTWASVKGSLKAGDTWSNDGTAYGITDFVADGKKAKAAGVSVLYWNADMNGTPKTDTNWAKRTVNPFSGPSATANKARLGQVFGI